MSLYFISFSVVDSADTLRSLLNNSDPGVRPRVDGKHGYNILVFTYCTHTQSTQLYGAIIIIITIIIIIYSSLLCGRIQYNTIQCTHIKELQVIKNKNMIQYKKVYESVFNMTAYIIIMLHCSR